MKVYRGFDKEVGSTGVKLDEIAMGKNEKIIAYHSSNDDFDNFSIEYINSKDHKEQSRSFWFSSSKKDSSQYGDILYTCQLNVSKLLKIEDIKTFEYEEKLFHKKYPHLDFNLEGDNALKVQKFLTNRGYQGFCFNNDYGKIYCIFDTEINRIQIINKEYKNINESVNNNNLITLYRGFNTKYGNFGSPNSFIWATDDIDIAKMYVDKNETSALLKFQLDPNKLNEISEWNSDFQDFINEYGIFDGIDFDEDCAQWCRSKGYNCFIHGSNEEYWIILDTNLIMNPTIIK